MNCVNEVCVLVKHHQLVVCAASGTTTLVRPLVHARVNVEAPSSPLVLKVTKLVRCNLTV